MPDRRNHRDRRRRNGARDGFLVESPEVFERPAATRDYDYLCPPRSAEILKAAANIFDRYRTLHTCGEKAPMQAGESARENFEEVADEGAFRRSHDADAGWEA